MIAWLLRVTIDVRVASYLGAALAGEPDFADDLTCIAWRESKLELVSVHEGPYDEANTYHDRVGRRECRACHRARELARKHRGRTCR